MKKNRNGKTLLLTGRALTGIMFGLRKNFMGNKFCSRKPILLSRGGRLAFRSLLAALSLFSALTFFACSGMAGEAPLVPQNSSNPSKVPEKKVTFRGTLASASAVPQKSLSYFTDANFLSCGQEADGVLKSAAPDADDMTKYEFFATATSQSGLVENGEFGDTPATARLFSISLAMGEKWTVTCGLREAVTKIPMMTDSYGFEPKEEEQAFSHVFTLVPCKDGSGSVALEMTVPATIIGATVECSDPRWEAASPEVSVVGTTLGINVASIQSGYYDVYIRLYNSDGILSCGFWEGINVFDGAKTNYWLSSGGTAGVTVSGGALAVGAAALSAFSRTLFYVGDTGISGAKGKSDSNDGTPYSPFETLNKAVAVIKSTGAAGKDYKIYVSGTVEGCADLSSDLDGKARSITIEGLGALGTDSKPAAALDAKGNGRALAIETNVPVILQNLRVTGGLHESDVPAAGGSGIYLGGSADLTLAGDVVVESNHAKWYAGGIFASATASLKIRGAVTVYGNTHGAAASTAASNLYLSSGAKIQILGSLKTTDASGERKSKIGISCEAAPTHTEPLVFTQGYKSKNPSVSPIEYFYGDKYGVAAAASGEASLVLAGGVITLDPIYQDITITIDKNILPKDLSQKKFTFSANANVDGTQIAIPAGDGEGKVKYSFTVTHRGETVPQSYGGKDYYTAGTDSVTLLDVPTGVYMICAKALYGGKTYSAEFEVNLIEALVVHGASGSALADYMLDPSVTDAEVYFEDDFGVKAPDIPDSEKAASGYYYKSGSVWQKDFSCIVPVGKTLELKAESPVVLKCDANYQFFAVYGTLVIGKNVTVTGTGLARTVIHQNAIVIKNGGKVILDGGTITNGAGGGSAYSAVRITSGGTFVMSSGLMSGTERNGAVYIEDGGKFEMTGGEISGNKGSATGGVRILSGGTFIKSGGTVKNNTKNGTTQSQMYIVSGGKYGPSEGALTTYSSDTEVADEF